MQSADGLESDQAVFHLLGLQLKQCPDNPLAIHEMIVRGLPNACLISLLNKTGLSARNLAPAMGVSVRTCQRLADRKSVTRLSTEQSDRLWLFAKTYAYAITVIGTTKLALNWLCAPALSLNGYKPIQLMTTFQGAQLVSTILSRLDAGVYT